MEHIQPRMEKFSATLRTRPSAELTAEQGLRPRATPEGGPFNHFEAWARRRPGCDLHRGAAVATAHVRFAFDPNAGDRVAVTIPPEGDTATLEGRGIVTFPAGAFSASHQVVISSTSDPATAELLTATTILFEPGPRDTKELRINTGLVRPATAVTVSLTIPTALASSISGEYQPVLFVRVPESGGGPMESFELIYPSYNELSQTLTATLPEWVFGNETTVDQSFETIIVVGSDRRVPQVTLTPVEIDPDLAPLVGLSCYGRPGRHKILAPPLDGKLGVGGRFHEPRANGLHFGVDYRTLRDGKVSTGLPVRSMDDGTIDRITEHPGAGGFGWGHLIVIQHDDGSKVLYAHLTAGSWTKVEGDRVARGEVIALSGDSGLDPLEPGVGPHLHVEFTPRGQPPQAGASNWAKVSVDPCVRSDLYMTTFDGRIFRYDLTSDYGRAFAKTEFSTGLPGLGNALSAAAFNRNVYAGGFSASLNGATFIAFPEGNVAYGVAANRRGVYVTEITHDGRIENRIHLFSADGTRELAAVPVAGAHSDMFIGASDTVMCEVDYDYPSAAILDVDGRERTRFFSSPVVTYSSTCAVASDRVYIGFSDAEGNHIQVFDDLGTFQKTVGTFGSIRGIAANERSLFVSHGGEISIFDRSTTRDRNGKIITDTYVPAGSISPGVNPLGLGIE